MTFTEASRIAVAIYAKMHKDAVAYQAILDKLPFQQVSQNS